MQGSIDERQWNRFRRRNEGLWCAVPVDAAVPSFLFSGAWDYRDRHPEKQAIPDYCRGVAQQSARINGFYLFQSISAES